MTGNRVVVYIIMCELKLVSLGLSFLFFVEAQKKPPTREVVTQVPAKPKPRQPNVTRTGADGVVLPILMIACDRKEAVTRSLDLVLK